jgi:hypothetical protein
MISNGPSQSENFRSNIRTITELIFGTECAIRPDRVVRDTPPRFHEYVERTFEGTFRALRRHSVGMLESCHEKESVARG